MLPFSECVHLRKHTHTFTGAGDLVLPGFYLDAWIMFLLFERSCKWCLLLFLMFPNPFKALHVSCWSHWKAFFLKSREIHVTEEDCEMTFLCGTLEPPNDFLGYPGRKINLMVSPKSSVSCSVNSVVETLNEEQRLEYHGSRKRKSFSCETDFNVWSVGKKNQSSNLVNQLWPSQAHTMHRLTFSFSKTQKEMLIPSTFRKINVYDLLSFISKKSWLLSLCMSLLVQVIVVTWHSTALVGFPHRADTSQWFLSPSRVAGRTAKKAMSNEGSYRETCCGAQNGVRGNQGSGARFPQRETKRKQTKGRDRSKQAPQTGPLCCKNGALNFIRLKEGKKPGVKHSLCNADEKLLTKHT